MVGIFLIFQIIATDAVAANRDVLHDHSQELKTSNSSEQQVVPVQDPEEENEQIKSKCGDKEETSPFEFMALEACLENVCTSLDSEVCCLTWFAVISSEG